ncbi:MAG: hypothetical protein AAF989_09785, partial [Planctomycetota bacterium]
EGLELLGLIFHDLGKPYESADAIERASLIAPVSDETRIALASSYAQLRRIELSRELYLELALRRTLPAHHMLRIAAGLEAIDAPDLSMQVCEWAIEKDPTDAQAFYDMGFYSARCGNPLYMTEAHTRQAMHLNPTNLHFRIGLISLLIQLDREEEAMDAFAPIQPDEIKNITCAGCLDRIAKLFRSKGCFSIATRCESRRDEIRQNHSSQPG